MKESHMRMSDVREEAWRSRPHTIPTRIVPDFEALFDDLNTRGWLVLEPGQLDHRVTTLGAVESKLIKDFKNWVANNRGLMLNNKRIGPYRWYLTVGAPYARKSKKDTTAWDKILEITHAQMLHAQALEDFDPLDKKDTHTP